MMAVLWLHSSSMLAVAALMLASVAEALPLSNVYTMCDTDRPNTHTITSTNMPIVIKSPNFGLWDYPKNLTCLFELDSGEESRVLTFWFHKFSVESSEDCKYDYVCIHGVKFCGDWTNDQTFNHVIPPFYESTIVLHSDHDYRYRRLGFMIYVTTRTAVNGETVQEPAGVWSSVKNIYYVDVKYDPEMPYSDACLPFSSLFERPSKIAMNTSSGIDDISVMNCTCECPMPAKPPNHYTELGVDEEMVSDIT